MRPIERKGQRCRVLVRGAKNSVLVEFEDGFTVVTSRYAVRRARACGRNGKAGNHPSRAGRMCCGLCREVAGNEEISVNPDVASGSALWEISVCFQNLYREVERRAYAMPKRFNRVQERLFIMVGDFLHIRA